MPSLIHRITKMSEVKELINHCKKTRYASIDFETSGLKYYESFEKPLCLAVSFQSGSSWLIPLAHKESCFRKNNQWKKALRLFGKQVLENWDIVKIAWNLKFEYKWFLKYGIIMKGRLFDAQLAKYCLDEERPNDLKSWVERLYPEFSGYAKEIKSEEDGEERKWENIPYQELSKYCGIDADLTGRMMYYFEGKLIKLGFYNLFRNLLMMTTRVLAESEAMGMLVDRPYLQQLCKDYKIKIETCSHKLNNHPALLKFNRLRKKQVLRKLIADTTLQVAAMQQEDAHKNATLIRNRENKIKGFLEGNFNKKEKESMEPLNWNSPKQVIEFFYNSKFGLNLPIIKYTENKKTKEKSDNPSTDEDTLLKLAVKDKTNTLKTLLEYRGITKLYSTYIQGYYDRLSTDDRLHASYKLAATVTGRTGADIQQIPRVTTNPDIKKMFIPPPGMIFVNADYGQAELRVVAELSEDKAMIEIFRKGYNIHMATACKINGGLHRYDEAKAAEKDENHPDNIFWIKQKKRAKTLNFQILYQGGAKKLAAELECSVEEAKQFTRDWFEAYPEATKWIAKQKKLAYKHGYVKSPFGRKRRLYNIYSEKDGTRFEAERQAVNAPIQGTSSDFALLSGVVIREKVMKGELPELTLPQVVFVHDSIGFYAWPKDMHKLVPQIIKICENPDTLPYFGFELKHVKMKMSIEVCVKNWAEAKDYDPWVDYTKLVA